MRKGIAVSPGVAVGTAYCIHEIFVNPDTQRLEDREVTAEYFKNRLGRLEKTQLPRHEDGTIYDMATLEGKRRFLDIIIDKELMVLKALQLGFDKDTQAQGARGQLIEYNAMGYFWQDEIGDPAKFVAEEDVEYYYSRLGEKRKCSFLITDLEKDAIAAREAALAGTPWSELVARYHTGQIQEGRPLVIDISWGQYRDEFERPVFAVEEGGVTAPIPTEHGYWLLRVNEIVKEKKPDLETIKGKVILKTVTVKHTAHGTIGSDRSRNTIQPRLGSNIGGLVPQTEPQPDLMTLFQGLGICRCQLYQDKYRQFYNCSLCFHFVYYVTCL